MKTTTADLKTSKELQKLFNEHYALWRKKNGGTLEQLAALCGVRAGYLSQIGRYGRVPGRPVLILLAFNFELDSPQKFFDAAGIVDPWPYAKDLGLQHRDISSAGFLSVKVDMQGLANSIREIVSQELKPRSLREALNGRSIRFGYNLGTSWLFTVADPSAKMKQIGGVFPELVRMLGLSLQIPIEPIAVDYRKAFEDLHNGELDAYGPVFSTPPRVGKALYSNPFLAVKLLGAWRKKECPELEKLPEPKSLEDLRSRPYRIATLKESANDHFFQSNLAGAQCIEITCDSPQEVVERLTYTGISGAAHLTIVEAPIITQLCEKNPELYKPLFVKPEHTIGSFLDTIAISPNLPQLKPLIDAGLEFIKRERSLEIIGKEKLQESYREFVSF